MDNNTHISPLMGQEISCVMREINPSILTDNQKIKDVIIKSLKKCEFGILNTIYHEFKPYGMTLMILLSESHLAVHTYPEHNAFYFSLYTCRGPDDAEKTFAEIRKFLGAKEFSFVKNDVVPLVNKQSLDHSPKVQPLLRVRS